MNKTYRVIFNHATGVYQCVAETAKARGKTKSVKALAVAVGLAMSGASFGADVEITDGQTHSRTNATINGSVLISNPNTTLDAAQQALFGTTLDTTAEVSNQALVKAGTDIAVSVNSDATVTVDNATLESGNFLAVGLSANKTAKLIGKNGAKFKAGAAASIGNVANSTASLELTGENTNLTTDAAINVGEGENSTATLSLSDKASVNATQVIVARG